MGTVLAVSRVLVIDDEPLVARMVARTLSRAGFEIILAHDVADALRQVEAPRIECVVADYRLPDGTAQHVIDHVGSRLPFVILTGDSSGLQIRGALAVLEKPCSSNALVSWVRRAVRERASRDARGDEPGDLDVQARGA